jgi:hypothetical protein
MAMVTYTTDTDQHADSHADAEAHANTVAHNDAVAQSLGLAMIKPNLNSTGLYIDSADLATLRSVIEFPGRRILEWSWRSAPAHLHHPGDQDLHRAVILQY